MYLKLVCLENSKDLWTGKNISIITILYIELKAATSVGHDVKTAAVLTLSLIHNKYKHRRRQKNL